MTTPHSWRPPVWPRRPRPPEADEPIYEALARGWDLAGRAVPGRYDREWTELAGRSPWPAPPRPRRPSSGGAHARG